MQLAKVEDDTDGLQDLYRRDQTAKVILDHFATLKRPVEETFVDRLSHLTRVSYTEVIRVLRELDSLGYGTFRNGRKGHKSRMVWADNVISIGKTAKGQETVEEVQAEVEEIQHTFHLRPDLMVSFSLPSDLTVNEAVRLARFVRALAFE